jgi:Ca2+-transporting ATPase
MSVENFNIKGLTSHEVAESRSKFGINTLQFKKENSLFYAIKSILKEPMVILLLVTSTIYFITGNTGDGLFLAFSIVLVATISLYQDSKSRNAIEKLKKLTQPNCKVVRDGKISEIKSEEIVIGDYLVVEEGSTITADGIIIQSNDFSVNESILTGESFSVFKDQTSLINVIYMGTHVTGGLAIARVNAIGNKTKLGKIGKSIEEISQEKSPLEIQINNFVKKMVIAGSVIFLIVWGINYFNSLNVLDSLLKALTLAMSILPEEIPVAFTTFMAMGAWRLMKTGVIVKQMKTVESLGSATVICVDKTGTITENRMRFDKLYTWSSKKVSNSVDVLSDGEVSLITMAMWASEPIPFDPMEIALHESYKVVSETDKRAGYNMIHEYPLEGKPPIMTHIFENNEGHRIIAAKGSPEAFLENSNLTLAEKSILLKEIASLAKEGYRVLGVGEAKFEGTAWPINQQDFGFEFKGLVAFYDPPKANIQKVFEEFYRAGIDVKIITGDITETTIAVARKIGFMGYEKSLTGDELMKFSDADLPKVVSETQLFTRMFPEAKLRIINALKANGEIVAMTGDGVNDGPALKAAHIGIAMGKRGAEIAKESASIILQEDDLSQMVYAVATGRKIYSNLKKAIQYIISIHIPIILTVFIPLALGWIYPNIFTPVHVILLELIMGPTCSIVYENEPMEEDTMRRKPRLFTKTFFNWKELTTSIIQGLLITLGTLTTYRLAVGFGFNEDITRTMVFTALISANIFLTFVNRSFYYSVIKTSVYQNNLIPIIIGATIAITALLLFVSPFTAFFKFERLNGFQIGLSVLIGFLSVIWYEGVKWNKRIRDLASTNNSGKILEPKINPVVD